MTHGQVQFGGRVAVITGACGGLGREYARLLGRRGARLVLNDIGVASNGSAGATGDQAEALADELRGGGAAAVADTSDVSTAEGGAALVERALAEFGRVDAIVGNAAIIRPEPFDELTDEAFDRTLAVDLKGVVNVLRAAWQPMRAQRHGRIVVATSSAGLFGNERAASYGSAKAGLVGLTRVLALEGAEYGIVANAVAPLALTRMTASVSIPGWTPERMAPELVAPAVAWLCHKECTVTGEVFSAGGGRVARVFTGLTEGYYTQSLTVEAVRDHFDTIRDTSHFVVPASPADEFARLRASWDAASVTVDDKEAL